MKDQRSLQQSDLLKLVVTTKGLPFFTTVLQTGIELKVKPGTAIGDLLSSLDGFTSEYLAQTVQTIFLDGTAIDDLDQGLTGKVQVLALSASMPGLAGAIFRKNSFHSPLRTDTAAATKTIKMPRTDEPYPSANTTVLLKLFNSIARERGADLLKTGVELHSKSVSRHLDKGDGLYRYIIEAYFNQQPMSELEIKELLMNQSRIKIQILPCNER